MGTYSDWEQRQMDIESGAELDRHEDARRAVSRSCARAVVRYAEPLPSSNCGVLGCNRRTVARCEDCETDLCEGHANRHPGIDAALAKVQAECERLAKVDPYEFDPHTIDAVERFVARLRKELAR